MINIKYLTLDNIDDFVNFVKSSRELEPALELEPIDFLTFKKETIARMANENFKMKKCLLAYSDNKVVGRLEYHIYGCLMDGYQVCYVDWICTSIIYRHQGVAQKLFEFLKEQMTSAGINEIRLIRASNDNAKRFYDKLEDAETKNEDVFKIYLN